jgi:hypothetical protein
VSIALVSCNRVEYMRVSSTLRVVVYVIMYQLSFTLTVPPCISWVFIM